MKELGPARTQELVRLKGIGKQLLNTFKSLQPPPSSLLRRGCLNLKHNFEQPGYGTLTAEQSSPPGNHSTHTWLCLSLTWSWWSRGPSWCPSSAISEDKPLVLKHTKTVQVSCLSTRIPSGEGQFSLPGSILPESQQEILIKVTGKDSLSGYPESPRFKAPSNRTCNPQRVGFLQLAIS